MRPIVFFFMRFHASLSIAGVNSVETVTESSFAVGGIDGTYTVEGIAVPLIYADVQLDGMVLAAAEMPDEWSFGQIHEEVQVVAKLLEEPLL